MPRKWYCPKALGISLTSTRFLGSRCENTDGQVGTLLVGVSSVQLYDPDKEEAQRARSLAPIAA